MTGCGENRKAYGVGLINTGKLEKYDEVPAGSLAEVVTSAKHLGKAICEYGPGQGAYVPEISGFKAVSRGHNQTMYAVSESCGQRY